MYLTTIQSLNLTIQELPCKYNLHLQQRYRSLKVAELAKCNKYYHHAKFDIYHYTFNIKLAQLNSGHRQNVGTYPGGTYIDSLLCQQTSQKQTHIYIYVSNKVLCSLAMKKLHFLIHCALALVIQLYVTGMVCTMTQHNPSPPLKNVKKSPLSTQTKISCNTV